MQCFGEHPLFLKNTDDRRIMMVIIGSIFVVTGVGANLLEWSANTFFIRRSHPDQQSAGDRHNCKCNCIIIPIMMDREVSSLSQCVWETMNFVAFYTTHSCTGKNKEGKHFNLLMIY